MRALVVIACALAIEACAPPPTSTSGVFVVDDPADPVPVMGTMTLRQAIQAANAAAGTAHHIVFQIGGGGAWTILLQSPLPAISVDSVWIDGYSQPGASPGGSPPSTSTILIQLDGLIAGPGHGLWIASSYCRVEGLAVLNFGWDGIRIQGTPFPGTRGNVVYGNFVGTDLTGRTAMGNGSMMGNVWAGVDVLCSPGPLSFCTGNLVDANLISGNRRCGVQISSCPPSDCWANQVTHNWIGTDVTGATALGNTGSGVVLAEGTHDNLVHSNVISANGANGVDLTGNFSTVPPAHTEHNQFLNNLIGLDASGVTALGNLARGVSVGIFEAASFNAGFARENVFTSNTIANSGMTGISVWEHPLSLTNADGNTFLRNSVRGNATLGIDLGDDGSTVNDPGDLDLGANQQLNHPLILSALRNAGSTAIAGVVDGGAEVHVYKAVPGVGTPQGDAWLTSVWPLPGGAWNVTVSGLAVGDVLTAVAMDWSAMPYSNTSEFSPGVAVMPGADVPVAEVPPAFALRLASANPFRSSVRLECGLPARARVRVAVVDAAGGLVRSLVDDFLEAGQHPLRWDGRDATGREAAPGIYFVAARAGDHQSVCRLVRTR